jgi:hypothetical protein
VLNPAVQPPAQPPVEAAAVRSLPPAPVVRRPPIARLLAVGIVLALAAIAAYLAWGGRAASDGESVESVTPGANPTAPPADPAPVEPAARTRNDESARPNADGRQGAPPASPAPGPSTSAARGESSPPREPQAPPAATTPARDPAVVARCAQLTEKASIGEPLTPDERTFLSRNCGEHSPGDGRALRR